MNTLSLADLHTQGLSHLQMLDYATSERLDARVLEALCGNSAAEIRRLMDLIREARELMIAAGESTDVPIQFRQHAWLREANEAVPPISIPSYN